MNRTDHLLTAAGLLVWIVVGVTVVQDVWPPEERTALLRLASWALFGAAFVGCMRHAPDHAHAQAAWVLTQSIAALVLYWFTPGVPGIELALLVVIAGQLPTFTTLGPAAMWLGAQTLATILTTYRPVSVVDLVVLHTSFFAFQLFAIGATSLAMSERRASTSLARANAELHALQLMLDHESRQAERLRIARELHDSLGHGLTAMALELEAARHRDTAAALTHIEQAQQLSKSLLSDLRAVVSTMRETPAVDLATALRGLVNNSREPRVELSVPEGLVVEDTAVTHAIVRAVQEAVTNARRHAGASVLHVTIGLHEGMLHLEIRDNGRGATELRRGLGLQGMRERFEQLGGSFAVRTAPGQGFTIAASVPGRASYHD